MLFAIKLCLTKWRLKMQDIKILLAISNRSVEAKILNINGLNTTSGFNVNKIVTITLLIPLNFYVV